MKARFPAYLLPAAQQASISSEEAERFLRHFAGDEAELELVTAASLFSEPEKRGVLEALVRRSAPELARNLPSAATVESRIWDGAYRGRLDVASTLAYHVAGQPTRFVTRDRRRTYDLPQTVLLCETLRRLEDRMRRLRQAHLSSESTWGALLLDLEPMARDLLARTPLQHVRPTRVLPAHVHAASVARHPAYGQALQWHGWLEEAAGSARERARHLARGALLPLHPDKQFEVAVLLRLIEAFRERLPPGEWQFLCSAIRRDRVEVARFDHRQGGAVELVFNQVLFGTRARDQLVQRFAGSSGGIRPDVTVVARRPDGSARALAIEVKQSSNPETLRAGLEEALFYRYELEPHLLAAPKAILVAEGQFHDEPHPADEVTACSWAEWPPAFVLEAIIAGVTEGSGF